MASTATPVIAALLLLRLACHGAAAQPVLANQRVLGENAAFLTQPGISTDVSGALRALAASISQVRLGFALCVPPETTDNTRSPQGKPHIRCCNLFVAMFGAGRDSGMIVTSVGWQSLHQVYRDIRALLWSLIAPTRFRLKADEHCREVSVFVVFACEGSRRMYDNVYDV
jgi:hypothetical protein